MEVNEIIASENSEDEVMEILPSIQERLAQLRPSRELLEFYREKINNYDVENERMHSRLDDFKLTCQEQLQLQWQMQQREGEISDLQKALSNMQGYLFQEREHVLRLYAENDRLKIRELEDRKKINKLLSLSGMTEAEVSYFIKEPPSVACIQQRAVHATNVCQADNTIKHPSCKCRFTKKERDAIAVSEKKYRHDNYTLQLQVESLQSQLSDHTRVSCERQDALKDDISINLQELQTKLKRQMEKVDELTSKLHKTQELLYDSTKDLLEQRADHQKDEKTWHHEKDKYLLQLDEFRSELNNVTSNTDVLHVSLPDSYATSFAEEKQLLSHEREQAEKMSSMYRNQVLKLEDNLAWVREEETVGKKLLRAQSDKALKRLDLVNKRYSSLEARRGLEREGFRTEIKMLKKKLSESEDRLYKAALCEAMDTLSVDTDKDNIDMRVLAQVRRTAGRSVGIKNNLNSLKAKIYGIENELKHL